MTIQENRSLIPTSRGSPALGPGGSALTAETSATSPGGPRGSFCRSLIASGSAAAPEAAPRLFQTVSRHPPPALGLDPG